MYSLQDLDGIDLMIKRLLKKDTEQYVKKFEYNWVALQKELDSRQRMTGRGGAAMSTRPPPSMNNDKSKQSRNSNRLHPQAPSSSNTAYSRSKPSQKFPHKYPPNHAIDSTHLFNGISSNRTSPSSTYSSHAPLNPGLLNDHNLQTTHTSFTTPSITAGEPHGLNPSTVDTSKFKGGVSNYQKDFNIPGQNASPYFNSSNQYNNSSSNSSNSLHNDVYQGLPETFV